MTPLEALRALPGLVERRAWLRVELSDCDAELGAVGKALSTTGNDGRAIVLGACAAIDPDALRELSPATARAVRAIVEPAAAFVDDAPVDQPAAPEPEIVQPPAEPVPEIPAAAADPPPSAPEIVQAPPDGEAPPEMAEAEPGQAEADGLLSCNAYGKLCGVSGTTIRNAVAVGVLDGDAVDREGSMRIRAEEADRQILERAPAGALRAGVAKRVERTVVIEAAPADDALPLAEAVRVLRGFGYQVLERTDHYEVNGRQFCASRVIEKATAIRNRERRLAEARRSAA